MRYVNPYSHFPFVLSRLAKLQNEGSFATLACGQIGAQIDSFAEDYDDGDRGEWAHMPATALFYWVKSGHSIDVEWLRHDNGNFYSDSGDVISDSVSITISPIDHLVSFGLWLLRDDGPSCGPSPEEGWDVKPINENGFSEAQKTNHQAECFLLAYQCLCCAQRLQTESELSAAEQEESRKFDFSAIGKSGATIRHAPMNKLREYALSLYDPLSWNSANEAAHEFMQQIIDHGRTLNAHLKPSSAQITIASWFRKKQSSR